jgi:hypothetical protein
MTNLTPAMLWAWLIPGYLMTFALETPVLIVGLSKPHSLARRIVAGVWLNACSYPIVVITVPALIGMEPRWRYLVIVETFAPLVECTLFAFAFHTAAMSAADRRRDLITITLANLTSFIAGELGASERMYDLCLHFEWFRHSFPP